MVTFFVRELLTAEDKRRAAPVIRKWLGSLYEKGAYWGRVFPKYEDVFWKTRPPRPRAGGDGDLQGPVQMARGCRGILHQLPTRPVLPARQGGVPGPARRDGVGAVLETRRGLG